MMCRTLGARLYIIDGDALLENFVADESRDKYVMILILCTMQISRFPVKYVFSIYCIMRLLRDSSES